MLLLILQNLNSLEDRLAPRNASDFGNNGPGRLSPSPARNVQIISLFGLVGTRIVVGALRTEVFQAAATPG